MFVTIYSICCYTWYFCCYIWYLLLYIYGVCNNASKYGIMLVIIVLVQDLNVRLVKDLSKTRRAKYLSMDELKAIIDQIQSHCVISVDYWLYY